MKRLRAWVVRLCGVTPNRRREKELADEIESHLRLHIDDNIRAGMSPEAARRHAMLKLGGVAATKEAWRDRATVPFLEHAAKDVRFAARQLRKSPGFATTAVLMLALGMCASVSIFAFADAALIKPLPYARPERLVGVFEKISLFPRSNLSYPDYLDWKERNQVFSSFAAYQHTGFIMRGPNGFEPVRGTRVTDAFFRTLGVVPVAGRDFYAGEDLPSAPRAVILSYGSWKARFGGSAAILGKAVTLNGEPFTVVGVLPAAFHFAPGAPAEFWTTFHAASECDLRRSCHGIYGVARLKDRVSIEAATANVVSIAAQLEKQYPGSNRGQGAALLALTEVISGEIRPILVVLLGGAGLLLLIAGINGANLLLVRAESRSREFAVRSALGASGGRLFSQLVAEALVLVAAGAGIGLALAHWTMRILAKLIPERQMAAMPYFDNLGFNPRVMAFATCVALLAAVAYSAVPALRLRLQVSRLGLVQGGRGSVGTTWRKLGSKLVALELATAMILLVGAGLLGQSLYRLLHVDIGLQPERLAVLEVAAPAAGYPKHEQTIALEREIVRRMTDLYGVKSVGVSSDSPVTGWGNTTWFRVLGRPWHGEHEETPERDVSANYFITVGAKLLRGRYFSENEDSSKPQVAIVNQQFAKQYFPGEDSLGKQLGSLSVPPTPTEIVGIVEDIKEGGLDTANRSVLYLPFNQSPGNYFFVSVRTNETGQPSINSLTDVVHRVDSRIVIPSAAAMTDRINESYAAYIHRSSAWLVAGFALLALLLGVVGLYGVVAYSVGQRTREIGVRMALGAHRRSVYNLILKEAAVLIGIGVIAGGAASMAAATLMRGLLFGVPSWDPLTLAAVAACLGVSALLASYVPARRAASVNPVEALRSE